MLIAAQLEVASSQVHLEDARPESPTIENTDAIRRALKLLGKAAATARLMLIAAAAERWAANARSRIHAKGYTDNVADLMIGKLVRLPAATQQALQQLACLGNVATTAMLAMVHNATEQELHASLVEARRQELVDFLESSYRFVHDRVHEAAYALIPAERRAAMHLRIGRMLVAHTPPGKLDEAIFEIVNQLNRASSLLTAPEEREQLAEFNLLAGKRAQASSAYVSALNYLTTGAALLTEDGWQPRRELRFALELARAHCEFASGAIAEAEERLRSLSTRAVTTGERVAVACLQVDLYQGIDRSDEAVAVGLHALRYLGVDIPEHPTEADARDAYDGVWTRLGARAIEDLINLPLMSDPDSLAAVDLLIRVAIPGHYFDSHYLFAVAVCAAISLGLERGHSDASCIAYAQLGTLATHFGQFDAGYRFGRLGCELVERPGLQRFQARTFETFGFIMPWTQHVRKGREFLFRGFDLASRTGEISYAGYACGQLNTNYLFAGDPLIEAQEQAEHGLAFARKVGFGTIEGWILGQLGLIRSLRGLTNRLGTFDDAVFREHNMQPCTSRTMSCAERSVDKREHTHTQLITQSPRSTDVRTQYLRGGGQQLRSPIDLSAAGASRFGTPVKAGALTCTHVYAHDFLQQDRIATPRTRRLRVFHR